MQPKWTYLRTRPVILLLHAAAWGQDHCQVRTCTVFYKDILCSTISPSDVSRTQRQLELCRPSSPGLKEAGCLLGEWLQYLAVLSGLLSRRTFFTKPAQAGLGVIQLSATWRVDSNMVKSWVSVLSFPLSGTPAWSLCFLPQSYSVPRGKLQKVVKISSLCLLSVLDSLAPTCNLTLRVQSLLILLDSWSKTDLNLNGVSKQYRADSVLFSQNLHAEHIFRKWMWYLEKTQPILIPSLTKLLKYQPNTRLAEMGWQRLRVHVQRPPAGPWQGAIQCTSPSTG